MGEEPHTIPDHVAARIDRLVNEAEDMRQQASDDLKQIYADLREELRGMGWTGAVVSAEIAALKGAIQEMRLDDKEKAKREEIDERRGDYVSLLTRARARERVPVEAVRGILSQSYAEAKGRDAGSSSGRTAEFDSANAGSNPAPVTSGELTDTQEQPGEPAERFQAKASEDNGRITGEAGPVAGEASRLASGRTDAGEAASADLPTHSPSVAPPADTVALESQAPRPDATVPIPNPQPAASLGNADSPASTSSSEPGSLSVNRKCQKHKRGEFCGFAFSQASCWRCNPADASETEMA